MKRFHSAQIGGGKLQAAALKEDGLKNVRLDLHQSHIGVSFVFSPAELVELRDFISRVMTYSGYEEFYIRDSKGYRMRRGMNDEEFTLSSVDECESTISYYFDMEYGNVFSIHRASDDGLVSIKAQPVEEV